MVHLVQQIPQCRWKTVTGFINGEILLIKKISGSGFSTEYVQVISSSLDFNSDTNFQDC